MNRSVTQTLADVDVVLFVVEAGRWGSGEQDIVQAAAGRPARWCW